MKKLGVDLKKNIDFIKDSTGYGPDLVIKEMIISNNKINIVFNEAVADAKFIDRFVLNYLSVEEKKIKKGDIFEYLRKYIPTHKTTKLDNFDNLFYSLMSGFTIILIDGYDEALALETKAQLDSGINETQNEMIFKGPKDGFSENYQTNIGLIRKRIKSEKLFLEEFILGTKSKTKVGVMYVDDVVSKPLVKEITRKIKRINIDAIINSNYVVELILENKRNVLSDYIATERPDTVAFNLLEGKIAIIVENAQNIIIIPTNFFEFFHSIEDNYQKVINANYTRVIRITAFMISILAPGLYISLVTYNMEALPDPILMSFASQRAGVPLPTILETIAMIFTFEILKETDSRLPTAISSSLSIVGAIVLGQAAVSAGLVAPITVVVVAISGISGMISSYMDMRVGVRIWRVIFVILSGFLGIFGLTMAGFLFLITVSNMKSFGVPYFSPLAPFNKDSQSNGLAITNKRKFKMRDSLTARKNQYRTGVR